MFLSLFPFPEVATIIALCLASIYVAFGLLGTNQAVAEDISYQNANTPQEQVYQTSDNTKASERSYFWHQSHFQSEALPEDTILKLYYCTYKKPLYLQKHEFLPNYCLATSLPNRAPPVI